MDQKINNQLKGCNMEGDYIGGDQINHYYPMFQDFEREFIVTKDEDIKPAAYFTGREIELRDLRKRIEDRGKSMLVSGMGGIGKTHICKKLFEEYVNKHKKEGDECFQHIGYIVYDGDMDSSLQKCLKFKKQDNPEQNLEAAWKELKYLASDGRFLLFVDNVNVPIGSDPGLKKLKQIPGAMVLTSRRVSFSKEFEPYRIGFLSLDQCRQIYEEIFFSNTGGRIKEEDVPDLEYIIDKLAARHTLTVEFLARFNSIKLWTVKKLRNELEKNGFELEFRDDQDEEEAEKLVNIQKSYEVLYDMSMLTDAEKNILEAFSVFPYIPLKIEICNQWLLEDAGVSEDDDTLIGLFRKGWLQYDAEQRSFALHPVFAQFIYAKCEPKEERHSGLVFGCSKSLKIPESGSPFVCQQYLPFAESIENKLNMGEDDRQIIFLDSIAYLLYYICEYKKAERLYEKSLRIRERVLGEEHPSTVASYNNLAFVYERQGEYRKAEELYEKSLRIRERVLGEEHPSTAASYNNLAFVYASQGEYRKAEELYEKSLRIRERVLGEEHPDTAASYNNLAFVYASQGEYRKAEELYEKSLRIRERVLGEEHPDTAASYNNLAGVYESQGEYRKAEELYEKSLRIRERVLGEEHPSTAASYNNLAFVYESQGEYRKAEELYEKSLRIRERVLGEEHPSTAASYNNLAGVYARQGEYRKAEELYEKSLRIRERVLGEEHPDTAASYNNLAFVYESQGEYRKAEELYEKSLRISERVLGEEHPDTAASYNNLAGVYESQGEYRKAEELYEKSLRIRERVLGEEHPDTAASYNNLAGVYESQGEYRKAEELYEKSLRISECVLGEEHPDTAASYNNLALVYASQGKYKIALTYLLHSYKILVYKLGINHPHTQTVYESTKTVFYRWDSDGNFEQWLEENMEK